MAYAVCVTFKIVPDQIAAFMPLMLENAKASLRNEEGCVQFDVLTDSERPEEVFLYELYSDADAFADHLKTAHFLRFDAAVGNMISEKSIKTYAEVAQ